MPLIGPAPLASIALCDGAHAWVDIAWLKANDRPDHPAWLAGLDIMLSCAGAIGWIDESGAVR